MDSEPSIHPGPHQQQTTFINSLLVAETELSFIMIIWCGDTVSVSLVLSVEPVSCALSFSSLCLFLSFWEGAPEY